MKVLFISLGCDKNLVDSEEMLSAVSSQSGLALTDDIEEADAAVVNTCCFIHDAKKESVDQILGLAQLRREGQIRALVVTGCLAQRYAGDILREIPEVDAVVGTTARDAVPGIIRDILSGRPPAERAFLEPLDRPVRADERILSTGGHTAYLRIAEGCDKRCTYCVIPSIRGPYRSVPMEQLLAQAAGLAAGGVKELIVIAQETTIYGIDLYGEKRLPELLRGLCAIEGIRWIRLLYCYPEEITDELIAVIRDEDKVLPYLDMPIQHASDQILRRMGRRTNRRELTALVRRLREEVPGICLRTTLITGFPGETDEDHAVLMSFVRRMKFDRLGVFTYSREEGTPAAKMKPQVPSRVKKARQKELMLLQQQIAFRQAAKMKGRVVTAFIEGRLADEDVYAARTYKDAPGVDGLVFIESDNEYMSGDMVDVRITGSQDYDLVGVPVPESEETDESAE